MACNNCGYTFEEILITMDDGTKRFTLCPTCMTQLVAGVLTEINIPPSPSELKENGKCDLCDSPKIYLKDGDGEYHLCKEHTYNLLQLNLKPLEHKILFKKYGNRYLLHDDFYVGGVAVQPVVKRQTQK